MGLAINSNFSRTAYGASAAMSNFQGSMNRSLSKISTGRRYANEGNPDQISKSMDWKKKAAQYEAQYYGIQNSIADYSAGVSALESALEAQIESEAQGAAGNASAAAALGSAVAQMSTVMVSLGAAASLSFGGGTLALSALTTVSSDALAAAYGNLTAADYFSTFAQNMAGAAQSAYSSVTDTDIAIEMSKYVSNNVKMQAAQAMVSQANQSMASMLNLLQ